MESPVIVALDGMSEAEALAMARELSALAWGFKVNDLLLASGAGVITRLKAYGRVFADPKLYDIPNTVANQVRVLEKAGADLITLHGSGGVRMMQAARQVLSGQARLLAVTVLTSFADAECAAVYGRSAASQVGNLARLALEAGMDGVVCSPLELELMDELDPARRLLRVTPGVRTQAQQGSDDQQRTLSAPQALAAGAGLLVVGRPITQAVNPREACQEIVEHLKVDPKNLAFNVNYLT